MPQFREREVAMLNTILPAISAMLMTGEMRSL